MTPKLFSELGLSPELIQAIDRLGFEQASPIQAEAIPLLMNGKDVVGQSQTGSGKTAAFGIPAVERVGPDERTVRVLILCPTRELAVQVSEEIHKLAFFKRGVQALPIYGGQSYERQFQGLKRGANIVIGTPGRVMDHMRRGTLNLDGLKLAVLDEADVMLNMGFRQDIEFVMRATPAERQTVFFSATMPRPIRELIDTYSRDPVTVQIEQKAMTVPTVEQIYFEVDRRYKVEALTRLIDLHDLKLGIIFCNTKRMVDDLVDHLNAQGYSADGLHGDMSQSMRDRVMNQFRKSSLEFLVATDVAARGIDVDDVEVVFNYDIPYDGEDYVHRIGRTGRKGRAGMAITFVSGREVFGIRNIERFTNIRMQRGRVPSLNEVENARTDLFLGKIRKTLLAGKYHAQQPFIERLLEEGFASTDIAEAILHHLKTGDTAADTTVKPPAKPVFMDQAGPAVQTPKEAARGGTAGRAASKKPPTEHPEPTPRRASAHKTRTAAKPTPRPTAPRATAPRATAPRPAAPRPAAPSPTASSPVAPRSAAPRPASAGESGSEPEDKGRDLPKDRARLFINVGAEQGVCPDEIVRAIQGETGLPVSPNAVKVLPRHVVVNVSNEHAAAILSKLKRTRIKGKRVKVKRV